MGKRQANARRFLLVTRRPTLARVPPEASGLAVRPRSAKARRKPNRTAPRKEAGLPGWGSAT